jgi:hypothetical protein
MRATTSDLYLALEAAPTVTPGAGLEAHDEYSSSTLVRADGEAKKQPYLYVCVRVCVCVCVCL